MPRSELELQLEIQLKELGLNSFLTEYRFRLDRRWAFDFAWPLVKLAVEVEGGSWSGGRHVRPKGFAGDCEKYNAASLDGWRVLRYTGERIDDWTAANEIKDALGF